MKCPNCGNGIMVNTLFCGNCGFKIQPIYNNQVQSIKKNDTAFIIIVGILSMIIIILLLLVLEKYEIIKW